MRDIREIDLRLVDTTILMVFLGCMRHQKATLVAREMGLTQPAVSHALKRLRALYNDPLFLRRAHGLEPTALAKELEPKIRQIVALISETLSDQEEFDPSKSQANLKIGAFDYELTSILPDLIADLIVRSPGIGIHAYPLASQDALGALTDGKIDLAIGYFDFPTDRSDLYFAEELFSESYVVAARNENPLFKRPLTIEGFVGADHLLISPFGPAPNMVDHALQLLGHKRRVQTTVPSLFAALSIIEKSDLVVTMPERVAARNAERFSVAYRPLPIDSGTFKVHAVRHARDAHSGLHNWLINALRSQILDIAGEK